MVRGQKVGGEDEGEDVDEKEEEDEEEGESESESEEEEEESGATGMEMESDPAGESCIASVTADFAMQNVLLQMGLRLVTPDGRRIKEVNCWVLRCSACRATTREVSPPPFLTPKPHSHTPQHGGSRGVKPLHFGLPQV
jgi:RNA-binding protein NOB1